MGDDVWKVSNSPAPVLIGLSSVWPTPTIGSRPSVPLTAWIVEVLPWSRSARWLMPWYEKKSWRIWGQFAGLGRAQPVSGSESCTGLMYSTEPIWLLPITDPRWSKSRQTKSRESQTLSMLSKVGGMAFPNSAGRNGAAPGLLNPMARSTSSWSSGGSIVCFAAMSWATNPPDEWPTRVTPDMYDDVTSRMKLSAASI